MVHGADLSRSTIRLNSFFAFCNGQFADMIFPAFIQSGQRLTFQPKCNFRVVTFHWFDIDAALFARQAVKRLHDPEQ